MNQIPYPLPKPIPPSERRSERPRRQIPSIDAFPIPEGYTKDEWRAEVAETETHDKKNEYREPNGCKILNHEKRLHRIYKRAGSDLEAKAYVKLYLFQALDAQDAAIFDELIAKYVPRDLQNKVWKIALAIFTYCPSAEQKYEGVSVWIFEKSVEKFEKCLKVINWLEKKGNRQLVEDYIELMSVSNNDDTKHMTDNPEEAYRELVALNALEDLKEPAMQFAKIVVETFLMDNEQRDGYEVTFLPGDGNNNLYKPRIGVANYLKRLKEKSFSIEQIKKIVHIPKTEIKGMGYGTKIKLALSYDIAEERFPGGVDGLITYTQSLRGGEGSAAYILNAIGGWDMTAAITNEYLKIAADMYKEYGWSAAVIFANPPEITSVEEMVTFGDTVKATMRSICHEGEKLGMDRSGDMYRKILQVLLSMETCEDIEEMGRGIIALLSGTQQGGRVNNHDVGNLLFNVEINLARNEERRSKMKNYQVYLETLVKIYKLYGQSCDYQRNRWNFYLELIESGLDENIAGLLGTSLEETDKGWLSIPEDLQTQNQKIMAGIWKIRKYIEDLRMKSSMTSMQLILRDPDSEGKNLISAKEKFKDLDEKVLREQLRALEGIQRNSDWMGVADDAINKLRSEVKGMIGMVRIAEAIEGGFNIGTDSAESPNGLLATSNLNTHVAAHGVALLSTLPRGKTLMDPMRKRTMEQAIHDARGLLPGIQQRIRDERSRMPGLMPLGAKVHLAQPVDQRFLSEILTGVLNYPMQTPFKLIDAGAAVVIPPMPTALETNMLILVLNMLGLLKGRDADIQYALGGRWNAKTAPIIGASMILGTKRGVHYKENAFSTTHDVLTGKRILAYDAGERQYGLPYDLPGAVGRTDKLGCRSEDDGLMFQILGTPASHRDYEGPFGDMMEIYETYFRFVLRKHGLERELDRSAWVYSHVVDSTDTAENHQQMVDTFTQARFRGLKRPDMGIMGDVRKLIQLTAEEFTRRRSAIIRDNPDEFDKLMKY